MANTLIKKAKMERSIKKLVTNKFNKYRPSTSKTYQATIGADTKVTTKHLFII
jgi:hypothetical protein